MQNRVLIVQPNIQHYRIPVFDRLRTASRCDYSLEVCGTMAGGEAIGGGKRDYFRDYPLKKLNVGKRPIVWWPGILRKIVDERPQAVVSAVYPSNLTSWRIPSVCNSVGSVVIGWTKSHSPRTTAIAQSVKRKLFGRYDYILAYSESSRDELVRLGYPRAKVFVTNNTIDTDRIFRERDRHMEHAVALKAGHGLVNKKILLCIAKMEPRKRHHDLLDAWATLREFDPELHLVMIGSGSLAGEIQRRAEKTDPDRIHFLGRVPAGMDYHWIAAADVTIQCGAVGLAINQSMAFGKPTVIADEQVADTEALIDNKTGFRFQRGNQDDLIAKVTFALSADPLVREVAANAASTIRQRFSIDHMVSEIHSCLLTALHTRNVAGGSNAN